MEKFLIIKDVTKMVPRFRLQGRTLEFKIAPIPHGIEPVGWIKSAIEQIVLKGTEGLQPSDKIGFVFSSADFKRGQGYSSFKDAEKVSTDDVWNTISSVYQSNSTSLNTETFSLGITTVNMPIGKGRTMLFNNFEEECAMRHGIVVINNNKDNLCLPRALVLAKAYVEKNPELRKIRKDIGKCQLKRATELVDAAGVNIPKEGAGISELQMFQRYLHEYRITVYVYGTKGRDVLFEGNSEGPSLNLLYHEGHYNVITSLTAAFCCGYYCEECHIPYNVKNKHRCSKTCPGCTQSPACSKEQLKILCNTCKRSFRGQDCFNKHIEHKICEKIRRCEDCFKVVPLARVHVCGEIFCKICQQHCPFDHLCYIQPDTKVPSTEDFLFIFYDLETRQESVQANGSLLHEPNLCVFRQCCNNCIDTNTNICQKCGVRLHILKNNPIERFIEFVLNQRKLFKNIIVLAHNGGGFDHQFILNYILIKTHLKPDIILRGTKLICMSLANITFLDSLNYFPMALSKLPKAFGFSELKKGYFPHLFNRIKNQNYVGAMPSAEFYIPGNFKTETELNDFEVWYDGKLAENYVFDFQKELVEYCISDVDILTKSCLKFRELMLKETNVCPFMEATTIASACNKVFRRNFLKQNTIGIIPKNGYRCRDIHSKISIQWIIREEKLRSISIHHAAKGSEARVSGVKIDGFCSETNQVFEFHGCYFHGCPNCFKYQRDDPLKDSPSESLNTRYDATQAKIERLKDLGYEVFEMWECDFKYILSNNTELRNYTENHPLVVETPLQPRDAFYGGRCGNTHEYYKTTGDEKIKYVDVCSLYPFVCKYSKFPLGHPKVFVGEECSSLKLASISGLIKCKILPPSDLFHPLLPQKINNKLMFTLCKSCGNNMSQICEHTTEERALTGTWVVDEVVKAIELGYQILKTFEVWSYDTTQFNNNDSGLFTDMMNKFIKIKQESSDWPKQCQTSEEKQQYIKRFLQRENVLLEYSNITNNPGLRSLAKLMLNSFWGKFGQRENQPKTSIINQPTEFFTMLSNPSVEVNSVLPINENTIIVNWEYKEECYEPLSTVNVVLASFVTSLARLKLYSYLEKVNDRVLYYDTDSIIYVSRTGEYDIPTGEFIGDMTNELENEGMDSYISEFVSGGPKNYAYKLWSSKDRQFKIICKVKGISLTLDVQQKINFESIKNMILHPSEPIDIISKQIRRTKEHEVVTENCTKKYQINSLKRKFLSNHGSVPFGFKKTKSD